MKHPAIAYNVRPSYRHRALLASALLGADALLAYGCVLAQTPIAEGHAVAADKTAATAFAWLGGVMVSVHRVTAQFTHMPGQSAVNPSPQSHVAKERSVLFSADWRRTSLASSMHASRKS